jgi:hypothetical protein
MHQRRIISRLSLLLLLAMPALPANAIPGMGYQVYDAAVHFESITTALMTTQTVVNQVLDLTPLDEWVMVEGMVEDLHALASLAQQAQELAGEFGSFRAQFSVLFQDIPTSHAAYAARRSEIAHAVLAARSWAVCTQDLVVTTMRTINHLLALMSGLSSMLGNLQGMGMVSQAQAKLGQLLTEGNLTRAAYEHAETLQQADLPAAIESLKAINADAFKHWPVRR